MSSSSRFEITTWVLALLVLVSVVIAIVLQGVADSRESARGGGLDAMPPLVRAALRHAATQRRSFGREASARLALARAHAAALRGAGMPSDTYVDESKTAYVVPTVVVHGQSGSQSDAHIAALQAMGAGVVARGQNKTTLEMQRNNERVLVIVVHTKRKTDGTGAGAGIVTAPKLSASERDALYALGALTGVPHYLKLKQPQSGPQKARQAGQSPAPPRA